jgi:hypothetical protein
MHVFVVGVVVVLLLLFLVILPVSCFLSPLSLSYALRTTRIV